MDQRRNQKRNKKKYHETKKNENVTYQNLWGSAKSVPRGKFIAINASLKK